MNDKQQLAALGEEIAGRAIELFEQKSPHQLAAELVAMQEQRDQLRLRVDELLGQRNATGLAIDAAILSGIVPEQHPMRSRLEMLANHHKSEHDLAYQLQDATLQCGVMAELLDELRPCLVDAWASDGHASRHDQYHNELLERIDALLAGNVPGAAQVVPEGWQLVPKDPTIAMLALFSNDRRFIDIPGEIQDLIVQRYRKMLAAAPNPQGGE